MSLPSLSPFPYCSALYDNVVVNRVYSELALGWTSKPPWTLCCSLGFTRAGLVAVLCKYIVVSFPAGIGKEKQHFSFIAPFHFGIPAVLTEASPRCGSLTVHCYFASVRIQKAGERSQANSMSAIFF